MTRTRKILAWTFASLVVLLAVLVLIIAFFDWNRIKPPLNAKVSEELHRPFAINGNLAVIWQREPDEGGWRAWVPWPHVVAEDLSLGNPDWSKQPQMATLKRVELRISPLALLAQRVVIPRIDLSEPNADLQRLADGRANWTFKFDPKDPNAEPSNWALDIGAIGFDKGHVTLDDQKLKTQLDLLIDPLGKPIPFSDIVGGKAAKKAVEKGWLATGLRLRIEGQRPIPRSESRGRGQDRRFAGFTGRLQAVSASGANEDRRHQRRDGRHAHRSIEPRRPGSAPETGRCQPG